MPPLRHPPPLEAARERAGCVAVRSLGTRTRWHAPVVSSRNVI